MDISRIDPLDVDLDLADRLVAIDRDSLDHVGIEVPRPSGPEVAATDLWKATDNHHTIAVNERLGCRVNATNVGHRRRL